MASEKILEVKKAKVVALEELLKEQRIFCSG